MRFDYPHGLHVAGIVKAKAQDYALIAAESLPYFFWHAFALSEAWPSLNPMDRMAIKILAHGQGPGLSAVKAKALMIKL